jgi:hypothetical protein
MWVYLNWALGLRALGCEVTWMELVGPSATIETVQSQVTALKSRLTKYALADKIALCSWSGECLPKPMTDGVQELEATVDADLLVNLAYDGVSEQVIKRFNRSAFIDIDPGLTQIWISEGQMNASGHDVYFTIGETVGNLGTAIPDCGIHWHYSPPPIYLPEWPVFGTHRDGTFTTITNWGGPHVQINGILHPNGKRDGFLSFLDLPSNVSKPMELAINLDGDEEREEIMLRELGWKVRDARSVSATPWDYRSYIQNSFGEFSCAKPSCILLQNAWISDRTICYLASGKPAVVQHTGPSQFLPDDAGLFRFRNKDEAVRSIETVVSDYERQCKLSRALAEEYFDARKVVGRVLERALA